MFSLRLDDGLGTIPRNKASFPTEMTDLHSHLNLAKPRTQTRYTANTYT